MSTDPPRTAYVRGISTFVNMSNLCLWKTGCGLTDMFINKSPPGPPLVDEWPLPETRIVYPESTPLGILTDSTAEVFFVPAPLQSGHGCLMTLPVPLHLWQSVYIAINPL